MVMMMMSLVSKLQLATKVIKYPSPTKVAMSKYKSSKNMNSSPTSSSSPESSHTSLFFPSINMVCIAYASTRGVTDHASCLCKLNGAYATFIVKQIGAYVSFQQFFR